MYEQGGRSSERGTSRTGTALVAAACLGVGGLGFAAYLFLAPYRTLRNGVETCTAMLAVESGKVGELRKARELLAGDLSAFRGDAASRHGRAALVGQLADGLRTDLASVLDRTAFEITVRGGSVVLRVPESGIYQGRGVEVSTEGENLLRTLAGWLRGKPIRRLGVTAFLDGSPLPRELRKKLADGWELATLRAGSAARVLQQAGVNPVVMLATGSASAHPAEASGVGSRRLEVELRVE